jgi:hypothetical protein
MWGGGTPEEAWRAIATGPGMSSWFVPSTSDERVGGTAKNNLGPGMESIAWIKKWNPPQSFVAETQEVTIHRCSCVFFAEISARTGTATNER